MRSQGEPSVFVSEAADLAGRASERPRGTKNARQIAGRDYEHSSTCQVQELHGLSGIFRKHRGLSVGGCMSCEVLLMTATAHICLEYGGRVFHKASFLSA